MNYIKYYFLLPAIFLLFSLLGSCEKNHDLSRLTLYFATDISRFENYRFTVKRVILFNQNNYQTTFTFPEPVPITGNMQPGVAIDQWGLSGKYNKIVLHLDLTDFYPMQQQVTPEGNLHEQGIIVSDHNGVLIPQDKQTLTATIDATFSIEKNTHKTLVIVHEIDRSFLQTNNDEPDHTDKIRFLPVFSLFDFSEFDLMTSKDNLKKADTHEGIKSPDNPPKAILGTLYSLDGNQITIKSENLVTTIDLSGYRVQYLHDNVPLSPTLLMIGTTVFVDPEESLLGVSPINLTFVYPDSSSTILLKNNVLLVNGLPSKSMHWPDEVAIDFADLTSDNAIPTEGNLITASGHLQMDNEGKHTFKLLSHQMLSTDRTSLRLEFDEGAHPPNLTRQNNRLLLTFPAETASKMSGNIQLQDNGLRFQAVISEIELLENTIFKWVQVNNTEVTTIPVNKDTFEATYLSAMNKGLRIKSTDVKGNLLAGKNILIGTDLLITLEPNMTLKKNDLAKTSKASSLTPGQITGIAIGPIIGLGAMAVIGYIDSKQRSSQPVALWDSELPVYKQSFPSSCTAASLVCADAALNNKKLTHEEFKGRELIIYNALVDLTEKGQSRIINLVYPDNGYKKLAQDDKLLPFDILDQYSGVKKMYEFKMYINRPNVTPGTLKIQLDEEDIEFANVLSELEKENRLTYGTPPPLDKNQVRIRSVIIGGITQEYLEYFDGSVYDPQSGEIYPDMEEATKKIRRQHEGPSRFFRTKNKNDPGYQESDMSMIITRKAYVK